MAPLEGLLAILEIPLNKKKKQSKINKIEHFQHNKVELPLRNEGFFSLNSIQFNLNSAKSQQ